MVRGTFALYRGGVTFVEAYRDSDQKHPFRNDGIATAIIALVATGGAFTNRLSGGELGRLLAFELTATAAFAFRRRFPLTVLLITFTAVATALFVNSPISTSALCLWAATYTVGTSAAETYARPRFLRHPGRARNLARGLVAVFVFIAFLIVILTGNLDDGSGNTENFIGSAMTLLLVAVFIFSAWFIGDLVRIRRLSDAELAHRNEELRDQREQNERRAVLDERVRIARELHDVVAHHVSLMGVQAGAARLAVRQRPERAEAALSEVERSSRLAVSELYKLLGFLRQDELDSTAPQPTLRDLPSLIDSVQRAGREVRLSTAIDTTDELGSSVQLTAYRIVQEALTNALKHSANGAVDVTVAATSNEVRIRVDDHGTAVAKRTLTPTNGSGHGLVGIRERIAFHGGTLIVRPSDSGFVIDATIPLALVDTP
jgi:signal transduction histidine kinase